MKKTISILLASILTIAINSSSALAEQKYWVLLWNSYNESVELINTLQNVQAFNTREECQSELKEQAFWQKENNDNDYFKNLKIEFLTPNRLVARVYGLGEFSQLSCVFLRFSLE